ncbi:MAG: polysaccharide biosynthesis/export family protein [Candidatus Omnitrophota bacterium]
MAMAISNRLSITDAAKYIGVTPRTIMRWEKAGKIKKSKRDWRGWRFYQKDEVEEIRKFYESSYEYEETVAAAANYAKTLSIIIFALSVALAAYFLCAGTSFAQTNFAKTQGVVETPKSVDINLSALPVAGTPPTVVDIMEEVKYTLGPNDVVSIEVRRHPEFSGQYTVNSEGKIEYKFVGDIAVSGLTKLQLNKRLTEILSDFLIAPEVDVTIVAYLSKVFYVVGEAANPGKYYMRGNTITIREALVQSGLPTYSAAMRKCRLITPNNTGRNNYTYVNVYKLLYEGDLKENIDMKPGDVLYIPATAMAKIIRVISPVTNATSEAAGAAASGAALAM